jgi:hypothetical protein
MDPRLGHGSSTVENCHFLPLSRCELATFPRCLPMTEKHNFTITLTYGMDFSSTPTVNKKLPEKQHNKTSARLPGTSC